MNSAILMGRLTADPVAKYTTGEKSICICRYTLAIDRRGSKNSASGEQQTADFINIVAFDKAGEFAEKYFAKGMRVLVQGRIQTGSYQDKDGHKVYTFDVVAQNQEFADGKRDASGFPNSPSSGTDGFMNIPDGVEDEGLPFN